MVYLKELTIIQAESHSFSTNVNLTLIINHSKSTGYVMHQQVYHSTNVHSAHTMCFVFISEQTATCVPTQHN